jgi:hypothetical protein
MFNFMKRRAFKKAFKEAIKDGVLSKAEMQSLSEHDVDQGYVNSVRTEHYLKETAKLRSQVERERRLSPDQESELMAISERLGIEPHLDANYQKFRELWAAENGEQVYLGAIDVDVMLKTDEQACFAEPAVWCQMKTVKTLSHYSGFSTSIRILPGVRYRVGNIKPNYNISEEMRAKGDGTLYITNKRLIHDGGFKSTNIAFNRIIDVKLHNNGIDVSKSSGPNDFFQMSMLNAEFAHMVIQELNRAG